jgi:hypothetical protein
MLNLDLAKVGRSTSLLIVTLRKVWLAHNLAKEIPALWGGTS